MKNQSKVIVVDKASQLNGTTKDMALGEMGK